MREYLDWMDGGDVHVTAWFCGILLFDRLSREEYLSRPAESSSELLELWRNFRL